ncbi:MAG: alpha-D-ribose 1-methylphosphonate 5-triphosphate diphosphatase [Pseudomonadota bacterium]
MQAHLLIQNGNALTHVAGAKPECSHADILLAHGRIERIAAHIPLTHDTAQEDGDSIVVLDASKLFVLPGIVDLHGDAFERQIQPRQGAVFGHEIALADTDRQLIANGITTACHALTFSWEGGLRGKEAAVALLHMVNLRDQFQADHRIHLRFETHHVDGLQDALDWIRHGWVDFFSFNDHLPAMARKSHLPEKLAAYAERGRCTPAVFRQRLQQAQANSHQMEQVIEELAQACRKHRVPMASHDDHSAQDREHFQALGARISEFPRTQEALDASLALHNPVIMGAPNVLLGGSHCGSISAADAIHAGTCDILTSDYYYPALLAAPFQLAHQGVCTLTQAWQLVSGNPAQALGLGNRGRLTSGYRADLLLAEPLPGGKARLVATIAAGKLVYCNQAERLTIHRGSREMMAGAAVPEAGPYIVAA